MLNRKIQLVQFWYLRNGIGEVDLDGSMSVSPLDDIVYRLSVLGEDGQTDQCEVPVVVDNPESDQLKRAINYVTDVDMP